MGKPAVEAEVPDDVHVFLTLFAVAGSWPLPGARSALWHQVYRLLMGGNNFMTVVLMLRDAWRADSAADVVARLGVASALWANALLALGTLLQRPRLLRLAARLRHLPPAPGRAQLQRRVARATFATAALLTTHVTLQVVYCLLSGPEQLLADIRYPLSDKLSEPRSRQVVLLLGQTAVVFYQLCNFTAFVGLFMFLALMGRAHLVAISRALTHQGQDVDLRAVLRHHQVVLSFLNEMEAVYHPLLLLDFLPLVVVICLMIFVLISMEGVDLMFVQTLTLFILYFMNVGTFCFFGTQITSEAEGVSLSAYGSSWQERGRAFSGAVMLLIQRAQRPFFFTAGKFVPVSITTFSQMMQDAFSYLMVMRTLIGSKDSEPLTSEGEEGLPPAANYTLTL